MMGCARGLLALALLLAVVATLGFSAQGVPLTHARLHTGNQAYFIDDLTEFFQWDNTVPSTKQNVRSKIDNWLATFAEAAAPGVSVSPAHAFEWIPQYLGEAKPSHTLTWSTKCFKHNTMTVTNLNASGADLHFNFSTPADPACEEELYMIATVKAIFFIQVHRATAEVRHWSRAFTSDELEWIGNNGVRVFNFNGTLDETLQSLGVTASLFLPAELTREVWEKVAERNVEFLRAKAYYKLPERNVTDVIPDESDISDGDFFGVLRLDGLDPMLAWAMGAHTGHTTIALRFDGELYICESTTSSAYWPTDGIQRTPYRTWIKQAQEASYNVVHLPLSQAARNKFDPAAARQWFTSTAEGLPYGFHNMLFSWVDLPEANYPGGLTSQAHEVLVGLVEDVDADIAQMMWGMAFNKRLNTTGLSVVQVYNEAHKRGISFPQLFAMPEQDRWQYKDGYSMVCDVLVCETWKAGGLFGNLTDSIQCTEFTNWDAYTLNIFDSSTPRPAACQAADPSLPFCQILGKYRMDLPFFNTRPMLAHMAERCPRGSPPNWAKPAGC